MEFIIGESGWSWLQRAVYRGTIGIFYENTLWGILAYIIFGLLCIFAVIGIFTTLKWVFKRLFRKKEKKE